MYIYVLPHNVVLCHSTAAAQDEDYTALQAVLPSHEGATSLFLATALQLTTNETSSDQTGLLTTAELIGVIFGVLAGLVCCCIALVAITAAFCMRRQKE